ncbi:MAG: TCR/Tet family MFS transporter [Saprospiraceae bacterium]|nr:TCR/Tet family MFS transporter [Bacteroidia bacterium]NNE13554.1 TCR/Tet family MFS transporter [Saprospiraceae bacterium]NNL93070.1 TCR/Tet family MFS transporter [Saprospiraceae bacterium]
MKTTKKAAVNFIFITLLLDVIGFGIIIPVLPQLLVELKGISVNEASTYGGYLLFAFAAAQFLFSPLMGNLSDQFGRRPIILLSLFGMGVDYIIMAFAPTYIWLMVGRILAGVAGASFTTGSAYIADVSTDEDRSKNFGMIGAAFGIGFIVGPLLGGVLGSFGTRVPFFAAAGLSILNVLYGYFILPESLSKENRRKFDWKRANPIGSLKQIISYKQIKILLLAFFFLHLGSHAVQSNWTYFTIFKFGWSEMLIGISLAFVGALVGFVQAVLAQKTADKFGINKSIYYGFALYAIGMFLFAFASSTWMMFLFLIPYSLGGIAMPNLQAFLVTQVPDNEQGELQGGLTSLVSVTTIFGPLIMTGIFYYFTSENAPFQFAGSAFFLGGIFMLISFMITYFLLRDERNEVGTTEADRL